MNARRNQLLALWVGIALAVPLSAFLHADGADVGSDIVTPMSNQPAGVTFYDAVWDSDMSRMVGVGFDGGDHAAYGLDPTDLTWGALTDYGSPLYGVDFDAGTDQFVMVGGSTTPVVYVGYNSPDEFIVTRPAIAGVHYQDVAVFGANKFVAITDNGRAFYHYYTASWQYVEITGALPDNQMVFESAFHDTTNDIVWMIGWETTNGWARAYRVHTSDLTNGVYVAYRDMPQNGQTAYIGGDWSSNDYGIIVGDERITKFEVSDASPSYATEKLFYSGAPNKRTGTQMVWCDSIKQFLLFGGLSETGLYLQDTWLYNPYGGKWTELTAIPAIRKPDIRGYHGLGYDPSTDQVILYGGKNLGATLGDTWNLTASKASYGWTKRTPATSPGLLAYTAMCYCSRPSYAGIYLYGGLGTGGDNDTFFKWTGATWTNTGANGPPTYGTAIAYDQVSQNIILFGGKGWYTTTASFNPTGTTVLNRAPPSAPTGRMNHSMVSWSRFSGQVAIYGGWNGLAAGYKNDCWYYNYSANAWAQVLVTGQPGVRNFAMAANRTYGSIYIFSGTTQVQPYTNTTSSVGRQTTVTTTTILDDAGINPRAVDWYPDGLSAIIAGGNGKIWNYSHTYSSLTPVVNTIFPAANYNAVASKAAASPKFAIVLGDPSSGLRINEDISGSSPVELDLAGPAISYVNFNTTTNQLMLNRQVDVDSGGGTTNYKVQIGAGHPGGATSISSVDVYMWHDLGNTMFDRPTAMGAAFDSAGEENLRMHFRWTRGVPDTWMRLYPATVSPNEETTLVMASCSRVDTLLNTTLTFVISPRQQVRATGSAFVQAPGTRYPGNRATTAALDAPNTWDFKVVLTDNVGTTVNAFDEFGFFKYTYLSSGGLPGSLSGSGAPMTTVSLGPIGHITFSSNCDYRLCTYVDSNFQGDLGGTFSATNMEVSGGDYGFQPIAGTGSANPAWILGSGATYHAPSNSGRATTTEVGHPGTGMVQWRCFLPSVPQDTYRTSITYLLQNQP
ncbi:MAG: kelch repeat-containing protein [Methanobacteriota archaeon]